jgi:hypothetical protein
MPSVLDLAELSNAAYDLREVVQVARPLASRPPPPLPASVAPAWSSRPVNGLQSVYISRGTPGPTGVGSTPTFPVCGFAPAPAPLAPRRWTLERCWPRAGWNRGGFAAGLYVADDSQEKVLAFRGTNPTEIDDLFNDAQIAQGRVPRQTFPALRAAREAGLGAGHFITGHSLGGALAALVSVEMRYPAVTFNAPAVFDNCVRLESRSSVLPGFFAFLAAASRCNAGDRVRNYRVGGDPVSSWVTMVAAGAVLKVPRTGLQSGITVADLPASRCAMLDGMCRHSMETVLAAIRSEPANYKDLP